MNRIDLLLHELSVTYDREDWYPPLKQALEGVSAAQANWRPDGQAANTIWETVHHLIYYKERLLLRLLGNDPGPVDENDATFAPGDTADESAWQAALNRLDAVQRGLRDALAGLPDEAFDQPMPQQSMGTMVTSIILHDAYHTGQIVQLRKLQGSWPARRSFS